MVQVHMRRGKDAASCMMLRVRPVSPLGSVGGGRTRWSKSPPRLCPGVGFLGNQVVAYEIAHRLRAVLSVSWRWRDQTLQATRDRWKGRLGYSAMFDPLIWVQTAQPVRAESPCIARSTCGRPDPVAVDISNKAGNRRNLFSCQHQGIPDSTIMASVLHIPSLGNTHFRVVCGDVMPSEALVGRLCRSLRS